MPEAIVTIAGVEMVVDYEFDITHSGCCAHMGSLTYAGDPGEPAEFEITVHTIKFPDKADAIEPPGWLKEILETHLSEREDISDIVQCADMESDSDEW